MSKRFYASPVLLVSSGGAGSVIGQGSGQGTVTVEMTYEEWWEEIAWEGANPDADYDGDGDVDRDDYDYYIANELWNG